MKKYYKFLKISSVELAHEEAHYPINSILPFGPPFEGKDDAKKWLKENAEPEYAYFLERFYVKHLPDNIVPETKKEETTPNAEQETLD
jgi:hypothetical protein